MSRILIAVPTYENIYPDTFKSIYQLDDGGNEVDFDFFRGYDVASARNFIGQGTIERGYDYVMMVDNDVVLPKDALVNLLETEQSYPLGRCMAVGYYLLRSAKNIESRKTPIFRFAGKHFLKEDAYTVKELKEMQENGVKKIQIRGSGLGCALIHRSIFERMEYPWFQWIVRKNGKQFSEDLFFCNRFGEIQTPIFVDTRVSCGHLMRHIDYE